MNYRLTFVTVALNEIADDIEEKIRYNALSTRLSKLDPDEFNKFMKEIEPKQKGKQETIVVDHVAQMKQATQG